MTHHASHKVYKNLISSLLGILEPSKLLFFFCSSRRTDFHFCCNCAFLFQTKGSAISDWWGQSACNELASYFTVQPLKWLVKNTSGSALFLNAVCFRRPDEGSGTIQPDLALCSGIRVATHSCCSVKGGGCKKNFSRPSQPRYDVSLFNLTHLRGNEQDASRGAKRPALKQHDCLPLFPPSEVPADCGGSRWRRSTTQPPFTAPPPLNGH